MKVYACFEKAKDYSGDEGTFVKIVATRKQADAWLNQETPDNIEWYGWESFDVEEEIEDDEDDSCSYCAGTGEGAYGDTSCYVCRGRGY